MKENEKARDIRGVELNIKVRPAPSVSVAKTESPRQPKAETAEARELDIVSVPESQTIWFLTLSPRAPVVLS